MNFRLYVLSLLAAVALSACGSAPKEFSPHEIDSLAAELKSLGADVDPVEADRAARIAFTYSMQLKEEYNVTDGPLVHNAKVNNGWRDRGICVHWAEDIEARLNKEGFKTLQMQRAIAEGGEFRIDHSTAVITKRGDAIDQGVVLDPWRYGGLLFWAPTLEDTRYKWEPRMDVLKRKYYAKQAARKSASSDE